MYIRLVMLLLVLSLLSACGQKGDLYLPESQTLVKLIN
jgi:predicted small lipoprotein YifL